MSIRPVVRQTVRGAIRSVIGGAGGFNPLVLHVFDDVDGTFVDDIIVGTGNVTEVSSSTRYYPDDSGVWQPYTSGQVGLTYANAKWWATAQPAATNSLLWSNDMTQWTETGTSVAAKDAVGLTGAANTACTLTDDDAGAIEYVSRGVTVPDDSNTNVLRVWVKKDTDETRFPGFTLQLGGGALQRIICQVNTKTGATSVVSSTGTVDNEVTQRGDWWECLFSVANNGTGNTSATILLVPARGSTFGVDSNAATGSCVIANAELHLASSIAAVRSSSPIYTTSSTVSVVANGISADDEPHPSEGGYFVEWQPQFATSEASGNIELLSLDDNAGLLFYDADNSLLKSTDGTNTASVALTVVAGTTYKCWVAYGGTSLQVGVNATTGTAGTFDGAFATGTKIEFVTPSAAPSLVRNIRAYSQPFAAAVTTLQGLATA